MQKTLSPREAWADFYKWVKTQDFWREMPRKEKRKLYDAQADFERQRGQGLGYTRIKNILSEYAPGRYEFNETVTLKDGK